MAQVFTENDLLEYKSFVHTAACYNIHTANDILNGQKCTLYGPTMVRNLVRDFYDSRKKEERKYFCRVIIHFVAELPSYARICGGMIICALSDYFDESETVSSHLKQVEQYQDEKIWVEPFLAACSILKDVENYEEFVMALAESIPPKLSFMREIAEVTYLQCT
jgi:hypothetical protein